MTPNDRIIVALDVPDPDEAHALIAKLGDSVGVYKIGLELLFAGGLELARELVAEGRRLFLDAKLLDIEATVERATAAIAKTGAHFLTVHATDTKTLDAAVRGRGDSALKLLGVTVLTNLDRADLSEQGIDMPPLALVQERARLSQRAGLDGMKRGKPRDWQGRRLGIAHCVRNGGDIARRNADLLRPAFHPC